MKEKIIFFGAGNYVVPIIASLQKKFDLELVVTTEKNPEQNVFEYCLKNNIQMLSVEKIDNDIIEKIKQFKTRVAILASFGIIVPQELIDIFEHGIINIHPSLLPKYRGATPVQAAIINGDKTTGVTIMKLDRDLDHGPILAQSYETIENNDTSDSLYKKLFTSGTNLLIAALPKYLERNIKLIEQDHDKATFTDRLSRKSGLINLTEHKDIEKLIRAYYPWPGVWFRAKIGGNEKIVKLLPDSKIQVEGKNPMNIKDFINGYNEGKQIIDKLTLND